MRKVAFGITLLLLLTGCWDRLPLRNLQMIDVIGIDRDEKSKEIKVDLIVTSLKGAGKGEGEPIADRTTLTGPTVIEAVGQAEYMDQGPFLAVNTRAFLMSETFAAYRPVDELKFLLHAPYTAINTPIVVFDGVDEAIVKYKSSNRKAPVEKLNNFIKSLESNGVIRNVSMMEFITSAEEPLEDYPLPIMRYHELKFQLEGAMLFHSGVYSGAKLSPEQLRMLMFMLGVDQGRQRITGSVSDSASGIDNLTYGFSVKSVHRSEHTQQNTGRLPKVTVGVRLNINVFDIGENIDTLMPNYSKKMEQLFNKQFEHEAADMIQTLQQANCDALGVGKHIKAYHPKLWKKLDWRKDFPKITIVPKFDVRILNSDGFEQFQ
ncbi:Ger(x)C family germination protein [Paenibacillus cellulosilyticus]|uniref:Ger(X)C family germination protein n=1 Tax=Paenibacillus cellulosilyticus TaxID=375489 RepID=A0A2V2YUK1_9BACL|nr:Ger(x)C family spore germination protein [Paenibacillus cellulosilyticus]PWW04780.1 Ger(x)C family germination protein [Paenibacillus cellulosilyticus]QKS45903.1 Ger(x)C family spore germination protein [Paenibacillus cellulosilyticus]